MDSKTLFYFLEPVIINICDDITEEYRQDTKNKG